MSATKILFRYSKQESAWFTPKLTLDRDAHISIELTKPGKVVVRQKDKEENFPMLPIERHKNHRRYSLRFFVPPLTTTIQIFTSTEPKEIKYAYISKRHQNRDSSSPAED